MLKFTVDMLVGRAQADWLGNYPFWLNFGYVVPAFKYAPKRLELIRFSKFGMVVAYLSSNQMKYWRWKPSKSTANRRTLRLVDTFCLGLRGVFPCS